MSSWRDKDNRERRLDGAEKENIKGATPKKKSLELDNEIISKVINEEIGKKGVDMDSLNNETETKTSPPVKKKVKTKIKAKQKSKQDINDHQSQNDNNINNKVNISTANNSTVPNELSSSTSSPKSINTNNNTNNTSTTNNNTNTNTPNTRNTTKTTTATNNNTQQDKMQKLSFLTDLYEQGYITVVEYKERKSQLIDELTGTRTRTRTNSHLRLQPPTVVASPPPDWSTRKEETAIKHVYDTQKNQWSTTVVKVKLDTEPFACGGLRKCYHLHDGTRPEDNYVAKLSIDPFEDHEIYFIDVEIQMHSKEFARKFNQYNPPKNVDFVMAWLLELVERDGRPLCGVETFIEGPYRKHNNNFGYVSEDERNTPQAFSHFTYEASNHKILICDIQGVADLYTDPQMHTMDNKKAQLMGKGNMGVRGISKFLATHQCNAICRYLRLPSINAKINDAGTVPAQTYMSYQKVDIVNIECYHPSPHMFDKSASSPLLDSHGSNSSSGSTTTPPPPPKSRACSCTIL